jgi:hypothetical protein
MGRIVGRVLTPGYRTEVPTTQDEAPVPTGTASCLRHHGVMRRYRARAEFRRQTSESRWVLAGVSIGGRFEPVHDGVEQVRSRLPEPGLVAWRDLPDSIVAASVDQALAIALDVARSRWPRFANGKVPFSSGTETR